MMISATLVRENNLPETIPYDHGLARVSLLDVNDLSASWKCPSIVHHHCLDVTCRHRQYLALLTDWSPCVEQDTTICWIDRQIFLHADTPCGRLWFINAMMAIPRHVMSWIAGRRDHAVSDMRMMTCRDSSQALVTRTLRRTGRRTIAVKEIETLSNESASASGTEIEVELIKRSASG